MAGPAGQIGFTMREGGRNGAGRGRGSAATLADVAQQAGVSTATVSRFLNQPDLVRPDKRARVDAAIESLGYIPHGMARSLASARSRMVGAVFPRINSILFGSFFGELQRRLGEAGYLLVVASSEYAMEIEEVQVRELLARGVDALVLVGHEHTPATWRMLEQGGIPFIVTWTWREDRGDIVQVAFSNADSMAAITEHVVALGHRRIGYLSGRLKGNDRARARLEGFRRTLEKQGLPLPEAAVEQVPFDIDAAASAFGRLMGGKKGITAVVCGSDLLAMGALREARRLGLDVPGDVTVTGLDDTEMASCTGPPLTTIRTPRAEMATRAARMLIGRLERDEPLQSVRLETQLVYRASSGPPRR